MYYFFPYTGMTVFETVPVPNAEKMRIRLLKFVSPIKEI